MPWLGALVWLCFTASVELTVGAGPDGGACVSLQWPVERDPAAPAGA